MKLGSLFDGSGGFPSAATMCGIIPVWASEVEPYPIAVTRSRFPKMRHLGDVSKVNGAEIEPVDIITFGSPCQDLSVAGKRAGIKDGTRSGLFLEAIRIIKEMRESTGGMYPAFALWENVPGAFSSNNGEDFRTVLQEFVKIKEPSAVMPPVPAGGWAYADSYMGDGWSLAYRTLDAQYWGVPQRRRRIYLVADFRGKCAGEILFKRQGLRGYFTESGTPRKGTAADAERGAEADDRNAGCLNPWDNQSKRIFPPDAQYQTLLDDQGGQQINVRNDGKSPTLRAEMHGNVPCVVAFTQNQRNEVRDLREKSGALAAERGTKQQTYVVQSAGFKAGQGAQARSIGWEKEKTPTLASEAGGNSVPSVCVAYDARANGDGVIVNTITGDHENRITDYTTVICLQGNAIDRSEAVRTRYIVRRLTPTECARLQGFPDKWGHPDHKDDFTDEECTFWLDVRNTHAAINGKAERQYTKEQMLAWYNKLHTDSAEYRMWGNGIALPTALYVMQGIAEELNYEK